MNSHTVLGGNAEVEEDETQEIVNKLISNMHLLQEENLKLLKVIGVTKQVVAGMSYTITGIFEDGNNDQFTCKIKIWDRPWLDEPENLIITLKAKEKFVIEDNTISQPISSNGEQYVIKSVLFMFTVLLSVFV
ncbi:CLUMA_CG014222, isoform A [Clunio marinus]|uniref:CLUMA_CG014222, isoform A n=1 Tax=Clunio marinus TaxID=568069 RepID=A0A1J1IQZ9_9DIPT|nr:CLUMA_CG014222, isoform A [Clunio marinus]